MKPLFPTTNAVLIFILSVAVIILGSAIILHGRLEVISNIIVASLSIVFLFIIVLKRGRRDVESIIIKRTPAHETGRWGMDINSNIPTPYSLSEWFAMIIIIFSFISTGVNIIYLMRHKPDGLIVGLVIVLIIVSAILAINWILLCATLLPPPSPRNNGGDREFQRMRRDVQDEKPESKGRRNRKSF